MNREETRKAAEVMLHYANGGEVQWRKKRDDEWEPVVSPFWNWGSLQYRIKPQPVEVTCYAVMCNGSHDGYFATPDNAFLRANDLRVLGKNAVIVELKGTYTCDT